MRARLVRTALGIALLAAGTSGAAAPPAESAEAATVRAYFAAYNAHDIDAVVKLLHADFVWLNVVEDTIAVEVRGQEAVRTSLTGYFRGLPTARSEIESIATLGPWVSVRERAHWTGKSGARSQASLSVYEVRDGLLRRVWYYPSVK
jgi:ketosteroid isomerase-like protein